MTTTRHGHAATRGGLLLGVVLVLGLGACNGDDAGRTSSARAPTSAAPSTAAPLVGEAPAGAQPQATARGAVEALLAAEVAGDYAASFVLLSAEGRAAYPAVDDWIARQAELPQATAFAIEDEVAGTVVAAVENTPGLDPYRGLSAAHERQTWTVRSTPAGWLVDAEPVVELVLPPDAEASAAAVRWVEAVQACDAAAGTALQAVTPPLGASQQAGALCGSTGAVQGGSLVPLPAGAAANQLVAQYSADVDLWARAVSITAPVRITVIMAPIGPAWRVVALADAP